MKLGLCLVLCLVFAGGLALTIEEFEEKVKAANTKCQSDPATAVDEDAMDTYMRSEHQGEKPANVGPYSLCMSKALGLQNADGTINKEALRERISSVVQDAARVNEIMNDCAVQQENDIATAVPLFKCVVCRCEQEND